MTDTAKSNEAEAVLYCDGGARGNPGPAAAAFVLREGSGENPGAVLASDGVFLGIATNNEAEYRAVALGLKSALKQGIRRLEIRVDSELIARQLTGQYRVRNPRLKVLFDETSNLLQELSWWKVVHVRRDANQEADALVNAAIDSAIVRKNIDREYEF